MHNEGKTYNYDVNNNLINSSDFSGESIHRDILPDTRDNWLADTVCEFLNIKTLHLFGGEPLLNFKPLALEI